MDWKEYLLRYENELLNSVIPFWEKYAIDKKNGGYFTFLDRDGSIYDTDKYMWMQWRIVYMFATLYNSKYKKDKWLDIAIHGYDFLTNKGKDDSNNYYFALNQKGESIIAPYNIYSEAFAMMGSAALYKATHIGRYKENSLQAMENFINRKKKPKGKWEKSMPAKIKRFNFGYFMILANLGMIAQEYLNIKKYDDAVKNSIEVVVNQFWNKEFQVIFENINLDYSFDLKSCEGRHIIPGHGLEACWFILQHAEQNNLEDLILKVTYIIKRQLEFGWDKQHGGIYYFMDVLGKPHIELQWDMKLWWVQCEALIAALYAFRLTEDKFFFDWFQKIDKWTWNLFPDKDYGEWYGYLNRKGELTHLLKGGKWKTFFHLPRCLLICIEQINKIKI